MIDTDNVTQLQPRNDLARFFSKGNTTGSLGRDFLLMWPSPSYLRHVDWRRVIQSAAAVAFIGAVVMAALSAI